MRADQYNSIVVGQQEIIRIQSGVIRDLFALLSLHLSAEELDTLPAVGRINEAAKLRQDMEDI